MMIFPGMDPYLEHPALWAGVHTRLIVYAADQLQAQLAPRYVATIEERVYIDGPDVQRVPDVWIKKRRAKSRNGKLAVLDGDEPITVEVPILEIHERYVAIVDTLAKEKVITVVEFVSPTNKREGPGRESYVAKQREVWESKAHLVEIDLLRKGRHVMAVPEWVAHDRCGDYHYLACVNRAAGMREKFDLYPRRLPQRLPRLNIPLAGRDPDVILDVQAALERVYEQARYDLRIPYDKPCVPPLDKEDQAWANQIMRKSKSKRRTTSKTPHNGGEPQ